MFHLAAQSFPEVSGREPERTLNANVLGTFYLLDALKASRLDPIVVVIGSSAEYGPRTDAELPLQEDDEFRPTSIYAVSKVAEDMMGFYFWRAHGTKVIRVRPFNTTGPRKTGDACSDFTRGAVEVEYGIREVLEVGNLGTVREFTDGRDAAKALLAIAERGIPGEVYNLCSGRPYKMNEVLEIVIKLAHTRIQYRVLPERMRPFDDPIYVGDNSKLRALGWEPSISLSQTLADMMAYWRERIDAPQR